MQNLHKKDSTKSSHLECAYVAGFSSWGNSTESHVQQSSMSESLSLKMGVLPRHFHNTKLLGFQFQDHDSSSTQSTGQSYPEVAGVGDSNFCGQNLISASSDITQSRVSVGYGYASDTGGNGTHGKLVEGHGELASASGTMDYAFPPSQVDSSKSIAHIPLHYAEPYFGGVVAAVYAPQVMIHQPRMMAMLPARVPLPSDLTEDEPIYVNAKQYHAILRRREYRAKLEAQNKLVKVRKPYLHESRHLHALKRARGNGGRFLNAKKLQESKGIPTSHGPATSGSPQLHLPSNVSKSDVSQPENYKDAASTTSCSDVTSASNSDKMFENPDFKFSGYPSHIGGAMPGHAGAMRGSGWNLHHHLSGFC